MPPIPGPPEQWRPPREPALYFLVSNVDRAYEELTAQGVAFDQAPRDMPWGHRLAMLRDPEGRRVCLAQIVITSYSIHYTKLYEAGSRGGRHCSGGPWIGGMKPRLELVPVCT